MHEEVKMRGGEKMVEEGSGSEGAGSEGRTRDRAVRGKMRWGEGRNMPEVVTDRGKRGEREANDFNHSVCSLEKGVQSTRRNDAPELAYTEGTTAGRWGLRQQDAQ